MAPGRRGEEEEVVVFGEEEEEVVAIVEVVVEGVLVTISISMSPVWSTTTSLIADDDDDDDLEEDDDDSPSFSPPDTSVVEDWFCFRLCSLSKARTRSFAFLSNTCDIRTAAGGGVIQSRSPVSFMRR